MAESLIRVDGTSDEAGVKAASSLKAELGIWVSPRAKTYKRGLPCERNREIGECSRKREREKSRAGSEPFLILAERGFKGISAVSPNALNFPPASRRVATFRFSSSSPAYFRQGLSSVWSPRDFSCPLIFVWHVPHRSESPVRVFLSLPPRFRATTGVDRDATYLGQRKETAQINFRGSILLFGNFYRTIGNT